MSSVACIRAKCAEIRKSILDKRQAGLAAVPVAKYTMMLVKFGRDVVERRYFPLYPLMNLWEGMHHTGLGQAPPYPGPPETVARALEALACVEEWCTEHESPAETPASSPPADPPEASQTGPAADLTAPAYLSAVDLAQLWGAAYHPLRRRLERWRAGPGKATVGAGWIEAGDRAGRQARYLYRVSAVQHLRTP